MKKISIIALVLGVYAGNATAAGSTSQMAMNNTMNTVAQAKNMRDNSPVIVVGRITNSMGDGMYLFEDGTDTIIVDIDDNAWHGHTVSSNDNVKLYGQIDASSDGTTIDVNYVEKM